VPILFPDKMAASFDRLAKLDVNKIYLAHGSTIDTREPDKIFDYMKTLLNKPKNAMTNMAYKISFFSPEYKRVRREV